MHRALLIALTLAPFGAQAGGDCCDGTTATAEQSARSESTSVAIGAGGSGGHSLTNNQLLFEGSRPTDLSRAVPSMDAPGLHGSISGLCAYSASGAVSVAGFGGAFGKVSFSDLCEAIESSKVLWQHGLEDASREILCDVPQIWAARERAYAHLVQTGNVDAARQTQCLRSKPFAGDDYETAIRANSGPVTIHVSGHSVGSRK